MTAGVDDSSPPIVFLNVARFSKIFPFFPRVCAPAAARRLRPTRWPDRHAGERHIIAGGRRTYREAAAGRDDRSLPIKQGFGVAAAARPQSAFRRPLYWRLYSKPLFE